MARTASLHRSASRNVLITLRLLNADRSVHYSSDVGATRWGDAIARLLAERGWTKRQLAETASVRPNTITNLIKHGKDSDTATLSRIAAAFNVDVAELFLTKEQSVVLEAHRETRIDRLKALVVRELSATVTKLVAEELARADQRRDPAPSTAEPKYAIKRHTRKHPRTQR